MKYQIQILKEIWTHWNTGACDAPLCEWVFSNASKRSGWRGECLGLIILGLDLKSHHHPKKMYHYNHKHYYQRLEAVWMKRGVSRPNKCHHHPMKMHHYKHMHYCNLHQLSLDDYEPRLCHRILLSVFIYGEHLLSSSRNIKKSNCPKPAGMFN